jgi:phage-related protein
MKTKKENIKKEVSRLKKLLSKHSDHMNIHISWNRKRKYNKIIIKNVSLLKEKGELQLMGIIYFTISKKNRPLMGQTMLLLDRGNNEISYTTFFVKKRPIEISYSWETGLRLMAISVNDY